ncbi:hypothetical protein MNBD_DELTA02-1058 [hydrothermal vent metagenome]|uniref:Uncharacterized protein n=1 Tax=hydrothermal vent metagenome TaxID=652676 RepID=A0A3B0VGG4_9ZZZZ
MTAPYIKERLETFDCFAGGGGRFSGEAWMLDPMGLRFRHGDSLKELRLPYHLGSQDEEIIEQAINSIASLLRSQHALDGDGGAGAGSGGSRGAAQPLRAKERNFSLRALISDSIEKKIAFEILLTVPLVDGAMLMKWLGADGAGKVFVRWVQAIIEKALKEEVGVRSIGNSLDAGSEPTAYLALLAILNSIAGHKEALKKLRIKGVSYEKQDLVVGLMLYNAMRIAIGELFARLAQTDAPHYNAGSEAVIKAGVIPVAFLSIPSALLGTSLNPYRMDKDIFDALRAHAAPLDKVEGSSADFTGELQSSVLNDKTLAQVLRSQEDVTSFRELVCAYLREYDAPSSSDGSEPFEAHGLLRDLYGEDRLIRSCLSDQRFLAKLIAAIEALRANYSKDVTCLALLKELTVFLGAFTGKKGRWFRGPGHAKRVRGEGLSDIAEGFFARLVDERIEGVLSPMRNVLVDRRAEFDAAQLADEYKRGRLYRFSVDKRPVVRALTVEMEAQLFIDMKDFTGRTLKVKEIAMADFMKENFYRPIIEAATRYGGSGGMGDSGGGIRLVSLPGDAALFSGNVTNLVSLARDVREVVRSYRDALIKRLPPEKGELLLEGVNARFIEKREEINKKRTALKEKACEVSDWGEAVEGALLALSEDERILDELYRDELESAIGRELEAGVFISYGAKAEDMVLKGKKYFGDVIRVTIGEKINEAARGTDRDSRVRARLEMAIGAERDRRRAASLKYPFDVYIDRVYTLRMPPEIDADMDALMAGRAEVARDAATVSEVVEKACYSDLLRLKEGASLAELESLSSAVSIHNKGQAMSFEALRAYIAENKACRFFFKKMVDTRKLDREIQKKFFFPSVKIEFVIGYEKKIDGEFIEYFVRSGDITFKGFESKLPTVVYEILGSESLLFKSLTKKHLKDWIKEAKK